MTSRAWTVVALLAMVIIGGSAFWLRCEGTLPSFTAPDSIVVGREGASLLLSATDADSGIRRFSVVLRHSGGEQTLLHRTYPGNPVTGGAFGATDPEQVRIDPEKLGLQDGDAFLRVEAEDWSWANFFSGNVGSVEIPVTIDLTAPRVRVETGLTYVRRAGSAFVVYRMSEPAARDGVEIGDVFFPGYPVPGGAENAVPGGADQVRRVALFAVPRNAAEQPSIRVVAMDAAGNRAARGWNTRLQDRAFDEVRIELSQRFMNEKVTELAEILEIEEGDPVSNFQKINRDVRADNEQRIREIVSSSSPEPLWSGSFLQMRGSAVTSRFAEHRSYFLGGEKVSEAIHFGYDLASTARAPIEASAAGRVLFADELGIYGNCVILDHGLGVASLYAHLSRIDVGPEESVTRGQTLGLSGSTGLAGGDHLHFAILVSGTYVDPKEWWDPKWVREHIENRIEAATPSP